VISGLEDEYDNEPKYDQKEQEYAFPSASILLVTARPE
jgi:hypothetical protein